MANKKESSSRASTRQWRRMDLHLHTPASSDYQEPQISYLDILRQADIRGLDIIAFTDHNSVAGYKDMRHEIEQLEYLESLSRLEPAENQRLIAYRNLLGKILVLPGFEFTATFGFHILGIFPPETPIAFLEHILLSLNIPTDLMQSGSSTVGATSDVLTAYRLINNSGGLVIAAHANSSNGVVMRGLDFGGQTKIAYTQDTNLHCLEVTDLDKRGRYSTRRFFDGSKPEYPRAMRCIQGSDAHRLIRESSAAKHLGVGDRATEILMPAINFDTLKSILSGQDFSLTRPYRGPASPMDFVLVAREEGPSIVHAFHRSIHQRGGHLNRVLEDVCAMANTNGGTIYIGLSADPNEEIIGVKEPSKAIKYLGAAVNKRLSPDPDVKVDSLISGGKSIVRISVAPGQEVPYAIDDNRFYVRDEAESTLAVRDEIVRMVERRLSGDRWSILDEVTDLPITEEAIINDQASDAIIGTPSSLSPPRTGVEIVASEEREGTLYHTVKDLRNGNLINNVTRSSARKLWHYAIIQKESGKYDSQEISWHADIALLGQRRRDNYAWYDLAMRDETGIHIFYGVTDSGLNDRWLDLVQPSNG